MVFVPATSVRLESQFQEWFQEKTAEAMRLESETFFFFKSFIERIEVLPHRKTIWFPHQKALFVVHLPPIPTSQNVAEKASFSARCVPGQGWDHESGEKTHQVE